jgi:mRNA interferase HigB
MWPQLRGPSVGITAGAVLCIPFDCTEDSPPRGNDKARQTLDVTEKNFCPYPYFSLDFQTKRVRNVLMRIVSKAPLREFWAKHPSAEPALKHWYRVAKAAKWSFLADARKTFSTADTYARGSETYTIFNVGGNKYRIIAAINYTIQTVFIGWVLTHQQYSKNKWKALL